MGKYVEDSDNGSVWPVPSEHPDLVFLEDVGERIEYPWHVWTGPNGARAAAEQGLSQWISWNRLQHPDPVHRIWMAAQPEERMKRLRQRARMISGMVPPL